MRGGAYIPRACHGAVIGGSLLLLVSCADLPFSARHRGSVVQVVQTSPGTGLEPPRVQALGTAWVLDEAGWLVGCAHSILQGVGSTVEVRSSRGEFRAEVVAIHPELDLALMRCDEPGPWIGLPLAIRDARDGESLGILGFSKRATRRSDPDSSFGVVLDASARAQLEARGVPWKYERLLASDALVTDGWSGAPMLNELGEVVGMLVLASGPPGTMGRGFGLPLSAIHPVLVRWRERFGFYVRDWMLPRDGSNAAG